MSTPKPSDRVKLATLIAQTVVTLAILGSVLRSCEQQAGANCAPAAAADAAEAVRQ